MTAPIGRQGVGLTGVGVVRQLVDDRVPGARLGAQVTAVPRRTARPTISSAIRLPERGSIRPHRRRRPVAVSPAARFGRRATVDPRTTAGVSSACSEALVTVPFSRPPSRPQVGLHQRNGRRASPRGSSAGSRTRPRGCGPATARPGGHQGWGHLRFPPNVSPMIGGDSRAPPGIWSGTCCASARTPRRRPGPCPRSSRARRGRGRPH